jgi:hypothetical protein
MCFRPYKSILLAGLLAQSAADIAWLSQDTWLRSIGARTPAVLEEPTAAQPL